MVISYTIFYSSALFTVSTAIDVTPRSVSPPEEHCYPGDDNCHNDNTHGYSEIFQGDQTGLHPVQVFPCIWHLSQNRSEGACLKLVYVTVLLSLKQYRILHC